MYPLFESIKVVNGHLLNLEWHQRRLDRSRKKIGHSHSQLDLRSSIQVPREYRQGTVKCRVCYGETLGTVHFSKYVRKPISSMQQVDCVPFDYSLKYCDRSKLEALYGQRGSCQEVLITINGVITDTSYSNVLLFDGKHWYTPETPLLEGTQRANLLASGKIHRASIPIKDLQDFSKLLLINAMLEFDPQQFVPVTNIRSWNGDRFSFNSGV